MDIKFDADAATRLIEQMDTYCKRIKSNAEDVLKIIDPNTKVWDDLQRISFDNNMKALADDLDHIFDLESEYMMTFYNRVNELTGG